MKLSDPASSAVRPEFLVYTACLALEDADIIELGCGRAEHARAIAGPYPGARMTAFDVDPVQYELNRSAAGPGNLRFALGGAEAIPAGDESADIVMMLKSLHHVSSGLLDRALREIRRVLRPGGLAYISEPVFAGELNEIIRIFHDERQARIDAFEALRRAVAEGDFDLVEERFFLAPVVYRDFAEFERDVIQATHSKHRLSADQLEGVRERFLSHAGPDAAVFNMPMRVDLLRKPR